MSVSDHYRTLHEASMETLASIVGDPESLSYFTKSHNFLVDFGCLRTAIDDRPEVMIYDASIREYQFALFALSSGQYRHSFMGLRLFFELNLAAIKFSAQEIDFRLWTKDMRDVNWRSIVDEQSGVFSSNFVSAFNEPLLSESKHYGKIAQAVYRECSEHVHGNAGTEAEITDTIKFKKELIKLWYDRAETMRLVIIFAFSSRYLSHITSQKKNLVENTIVETIGNISAIQQMFS